MNIGEIISDCISYPFQNIKALLIYLILGILVGVVAALTGLGSITTGTLNFDSGVLLGVIGLIIIIAINLLMLGFSLDIVKFGINRSSHAPEIDFARQVANGLKYIIVSIVYMIIPIIVIFVLSLIFQNWIVIVIGIILAIIFAFVLTMAVCRLADTDDLGYALNVGGAIDDLNRIGVGSVVVTLLAALIAGFIIVFVISFILGVILSIAGAGETVTFIVTIISAILDAWLLFYMNRAMGLIYSNK